MFSTNFDEIRKFWYGDYNLLEYKPKISLGQALLNSMRVFGSKLAQISNNNGIEMTFDEIRLKTIRAAQHLEARGFQHNGVIGFLVGNHSNLAPIAFASIAIGCAICPFDPSMERTNLLNMLKMTEPVLMFCESNCYAKLNECLMELGNKAKIFVFEGNQSESVNNLLEKTHKENQFTPFQVDILNESAIMLCIEDSRAVCLSHAAILNSISDRFLPCNSNDFMLCFSSLHRFSGLATLLRGTLYGATRIITLEQFAPDLQLRFIEQYKVTFTFNTPIEIALMAKCDNFQRTNLLSIKYALVAGGSIPLRIKKDFNERLQNGNIFAAYERHEFSGFVAIDSPPTLSSLHADIVVGRLSSGCSIKIIDNHGNRCGVNVPGEIFVKTTTKCLGCYDIDQKLNNNGRFDTEGFVATDDIGFFDIDGNLHIIDRRSELLRYHDYYVSASEIGTYLIGKPDIQLACVVGINNDDSGDLPAAAIIQTHQSSSITENDVYDMVAGHFDDHYKLRGGVYFVDALPFDSTGKINRQMVKEMVTELRYERSC